MNLGGDELGKQMVRQVLANLADGASGRTACSRFVQETRRRVRVLRCKVRREDGREERAEGDGKGRRLGDRQVGGGRKKKKENESSSLEEVMRLGCC
jgi:hypothetical protein